MNAFRLALLAGLLAMCMATDLTWAQTYPNKPIKLIIPYAAGQGTDLIGRYVADELARKIRQPMVIDNRPGAGGNIGTQLAARAPADGYTLMVGTNATHAANAFLYERPGYDVQADFEPIAMIGIMPLVYATAPQQTVNNIPELIAAAKAKPDALNTAVSTTTCRMAHELFKMHTSVSMLPVDFKGSAQSISAVLGSHVEFMVDTVASLQAQINAGQLKALGVTSAHASRLLPGVKSIAEQGVTGYELVGWAVIFAPKGVPAQVSQVISSALAQLLSTPQHQAKLMQMGIDPQFKTGQELKDFVGNEKDKWGRLVQAAGLKPS